MGKLTNKNSPAKKTFHVIVCCSIFYFGTSESLKICYRKANFILKKGSKFYFADLIIFIFLMGRL